MARCDYCHEFATARFVIEEGRMEGSTVIPAIYAHTCDLHASQVLRAISEKRPAPQRQGWITRRWKAAQTRFGE